MKNCFFNLCRTKLWTVALAGFMCAIVGEIAGPAAAQQSQNSAPVPWSQCCGMGPWMMGQGMMGSGYGSTPRYGFAMSSGIPAPYRSLSNPLPRTSETVKKGAAIYEQNCAACHGTSGEGNGAAAQNLSPRPTNLAWLAQMPMIQWDSFMYWSVAEGGAQFGSAMPAFKDTLTKDDIWTVVAYIQARLPQNVK